MECEIPEFYHTVHVTARKSHKCCECFAPIHPGELYLRCNMKYDGMVVSEKQHMLCALACEFVRDHDLNDDDCLPYGYLLEWFDDRDASWQVIDKSSIVESTLRVMVANIMRRKRAESRPKPTRGEP